MRFKSAARCLLFLLPISQVVVPLGLLVICSCRDLPVRRGITAVWAIDESEKVRRDELDHWGKSDPRNGVWKGSAIKIFGARNEIVGFQVILEAAGLGAESVMVSLDSLRSGVDVISNSRHSADPYDYVGRRIELFTESYLEIRSRGRWSPASARPLRDKDHLGWIPDALVPIETKGAFPHGSGGGPFAIAAESNQAIWVDIFIPSSQPSGEYRGDLQVREGKRITYTVPVVLDVYAFTLPDTTHLKNHFSWNKLAIVNRHGIKDDSPEYWEVFHNYEKTFHRHRLDLIDGRRKLPVFSRQLGGYYTGKFYTPRYEYEGPGTATGNGTYSIGTYDQPLNGWVSGFFPDTPGVWQAAADAWESWFQTNAPGVVRFKYMEDEAPYYHWPNVIRKAHWIKTSSGPGKDLKIAFSTRLSPELVGSVDFWLVEGHAGFRDSGGTIGFDIPVAHQRQAAGELVGVYNAQRPSYGDPHAIDDFATDARINPWICWKYGVDQYFYWETAYYAETAHDIWAAPYAGSLVYTGVDVTHPDENRGLKGPIMSLRLKNLRRGFQDYEYLWLARVNGISTEAIVNAIVPAAFNDYDNTSLTSQSDQPTWAEHGYVYEEARRSLAELLQKKLLDQYKTKP